MGNRGEPATARETEQPKPSVRRNTKAAKKESARAVVTSTFNAVNTVVSATVSPRAAMKAYEREMIEEPLLIYAELHADAVTKGGEIIGPATCVVGLVFWLKRVNDIRVENRRANSPQSPATLHIVQPQSQRVGDTSPVSDQPDQPPPAYFADEQPLTEAEILARTPTQEWLQGITSIGG